MLTASFLIASTAHAEPPVKGYILADQSNMQGKAAVEGKVGNSLRKLFNLMKGGKPTIREEAQALMKDN